MHASGLDEDDEDTIVFHFSAISLRFTDERLGSAIWNRYHCYHQQTTLFVTPVALGIMTYFLVIHWRMETLPWLIALRLIAAIVTLLPLLWLLLFDPPWNCRVLGAFPSVHQSCLGSVFSKILGVHRRKWAVAFNDDSSSVSTRAHEGPLQSLQPMRNACALPPFEPPRYALYSLNFLALITHFVSAFAGMACHPKVSHQEQYVILLLLVSFVCGMWFFRHVFGVGLVGVVAYIVLWHVYAIPGSTHTVLSVVSMFVLVAVACYIQESREVRRVLLCYRLKLMCTRVINMDFDEFDEFWEKQPNAKDCVEGYLHSMLQHLKHFRSYLPPVVHRFDCQSQLNPNGRNHGHSPKGRYVPRGTAGSPRPSNAKPFGPSASQASSLVSQRAQPNPAARLHHFYRGSTQSLMGQPQHSQHLGDQTQLNKSPSNISIRAPPMCVVEHGYSVRRATVMVLRLPVVYPNPESLQTHSRFTDAETLYRIDKKFLKLVLPIVSETGGVPASFGGGVVVATWNAHRANLEHAYWACMCAKLVTNAIKQLPEYSPAYLPYVAITSGPLVVGTAGTEALKMPIVVGTTLDLALELVSLNKLLNTNVLISQDVNEAVCCFFETDIVDYFSLTRCTPGRCAVYELCSLRTATGVEMGSAQELLYKNAFLDFVHHRFGQCERRMTLYLQEWRQWHQARPQLPDLLPDGDLQSGTVPAGDPPHRVRYNPHQAMRILKLAKYYNHQDRAGEMAMPYARRLDWTPNVSEQDAVTLTGAMLELEQAIPITSGKLPNNASIEVLHSLSKSSSEKLRLQLQVENSKGQSGDNPEGGGSPVSGPKDRTAIKMLPHNATFDDSDVESPTAARRLPEPPQKLQCIPGTIQDNLEAILDEAEHKRAGSMATCSLSELQLSIRKTMTQVLTPEPAQAPAAPGTASSSGPPRRPASGLVFVDRSPLQELQALDSSSGSRGHVPTGAPAGAPGDWTNNYNASRLSVSRKAQSCDSFQENQRRVQIQSTPAKPLHSTVRHTHKISTLNATLNPRSPAEASLAPDGRGTASDIETGSATSTSRSGGAPAAAAGPVVPRQGQGIAFVQSVNSVWSMSADEGHDNAYDHEGVFLFRDCDNREWECSNDVVGEGAYGSVHLGMSQSGTLVAIKKLRMDARRSSAYDAEDEESDRGSSASIKDEVLNNVLDEIRLLSMLSHDNIVGYLGSCVIDMTMMIVMEYVAGGSMAYILEKFGKISPSSTAHYCRHILRGLQYLHSHDVVHLDVKPGNVLVGDHGRCKLVDFGTASMYNTSTKASTVRGTPLYMAPEAIRGQATKTSDIWSFGMTVLELLTGKEGWPVTPDMNPFFLMEMIANPSNAPIVPDTIPQPARLFVLRSTDRNPGSRPTAQQLLDDAFLL